MKIREDNLHIKMFTAIDVIFNNNLFYIQNRFVRRLSEHEHEWIKQGRKMKDNFEQNKLVALAMIDNKID